MDRNIYAGSVLALAMLNVGPAYADDAMMDDLMSFSLDELLQIQVTVASLLDSDELHAPSNTSTITRQDWQRSGARRTLDAIDHLPSTIILPFTSGIDLIAIRGYAQPTSARGIASTLDGIRLNNFLFGTAQFATQNINLGILDRIEMIRGPASALYGTDAFHGVLSLQAFESQRDTNQASIEAGDNGYYHLAARHSSSLTDSVRLNLAAAGSGEPDQDVRYDYTDPVTSEPLFIDKEQRYQSNSLSLKLASDSADTLSWKWGLYADQYQADDFTYGSATYEANQDTFNYMSRLAVTKRLQADASLEASVYYRNSDVERVTIPPAGALSPGSRLEAEEYFYGAALTMRQPRKSGSSTQWAASLSYDAAVADEIHTFLLNAPDDPFQPISEARKREITGLVLEANPELSNPQWNLVYGGRVDHYSDFGIETSPRLGIIYQPTDDSAIKLLYGRAYRAPTAGELYFQLQNGFGTEGNRNLNPELMDSLELVWMQQGHNWKANLVLFENRWKDTISFAVTDQGTGTYVNSGDSKAHGVEASLTWLPKPWRVELNTSYTASRNEMTDQDFTLFPRVIANLGIGYDWEAYDTGITLTTRSYSKVDASYYSTDNLPVYSRSDLVIQHNFDRQLQGFINIINLFDRDNQVPSVVGVQNGVPDDAFSISVGIRYEF